MSHNLIPVTFFIIAGCLLFAGIQFFVRERRFKKYAVKTYAIATGNGSNEFLLSENGVDIHAKAEPSSYKKEIRHGDLVKVAFWTHKSFGENTYQLRVIDKHYVYKKHPYMTAGIIMGLGIALAVVTFVFFIH